MDLSSFSNLKSGSPQERKEALKQQITSEIAMQNAQQLITKATEKCYAKCVTSPSTSLSGKEEKCLGQCLERYFEAFNVVSGAYVKRVAEQRGTTVPADMGI
ncbi:uncharacterized protein FA14DRAFT_133066 [Meira miltonrushii]|uniref:Mitochondrial import inner membrane translocase subunit n=1 Tax=Meira miltonrushii TaxID=1280837 RepID=A0A316VBT5_9BASI|nr:uncharacterized protein FA14DRAFT_133066 [Meira miltonrushii]PWN35089.1 hypothetical protein FA14DRAFT_133066 [Meira miltonrushii]